MLTAETGTGKTLAYLLPIFARLDPTQATAQAVILAPSHELAIQIHRQCCDLGQNAGMPVRSLLLIGGTSMERQLDKLKQKPHVVVGTPGRVHELITRNKLKVSAVRTVVMDEADHLMSGDSRSLMRAIVGTMPATVQLVFVSATTHADAVAAIEAMAPGVERLSPGTNAVNSDITHLVMVCEARDKPKLLRQVLSAMQPDRALVFAQDDALAERATADLAYHHVPTVELHADFAKFDRKQAMDDFRAGRAQVMVASDMAARGLDLPGITHVIQLDAPRQPRAYLHRAGRTGRAGCKGVSLTLLGTDERRLLKRYETDLGITLIEVRLREGRVVSVDAPDPAEGRDEH